MELIHRNCKRIVFLDVSNSLRLLTPSYTINGSSGIDVGVVEPHPSKKKTYPSFFCLECERDIDGTSDDLLGRCQVCRNHKPTSELWVTDSVPVICDGCLQEFITHKPTTTRATEFLKFVTVTKDSTKKSLVDALKQKINL